MAQIPPPGRLPGPEHAARVARLSEQIDRRHGGEVRRLRRLLFETTPMRDALLNGTPPGISVTSVVDSHGRLTVMASISELEEAPTGLSGGCFEVLVSIVGHHRVLDRRVSVDPAEEEAWALLAFGPWAQHAYRQQGAVTNVNGQPGAAFYIVFLDIDRNPTSPPQKDPWPAPLLPLADTPGA